MKTWSISIVALLVYSVFEPTVTKAQDIDYSYDIYDLLGHKIPDFEAKALNGDYFSSDELKGKNVMLVFWSTRCGGCNKEIKDLNRIIKGQKGTDFLLMSIVDETSEELRDTNRNIYIMDNDNGFYKYSKPVMGSEVIDFQIIPNGLEIRDKIKLPKTSPVILFIDKQYVVQDLVPYYNVYNHYEKLMKKLMALREG